MRKEAILEGLLFVTGEDGLELDQIKEILDVNDREAKELIDLLSNRYSSDEYGIKIELLGNAYKFTTKKEHKPYYEKLIESPSSNILSQAALETLAIIAYNSPITRIEVDEIRGVSSAQMMRKLVAKGFIKEVGRSELAGRPILYEITNEFLDYFGLSSKEDLPTFELAKDSDEELDLFNSRYKENVDSE